MQKEPMTKRGYDRLKAELDERLNVQRPRIIAAISEARAQGDLSENAEYHAAKEEQGHNENRINALEKALGSAEVIDTSRMNNKNVVFGATVTIIDVETEEEKTYQIVGTHEADLEHGLVSVQSPLARALIGKTTDDEVVVKAPKGDMCYVIGKIEYL